MLILQNVLGIEILSTLSILILVIWGAFNLGLPTEMIKYKNKH